MSIGTKQSKLSIAGEAVFLSQEERTHIDKLIAKGDQNSQLIKKLLTIHDALCDDVLAESINAALKFIETAKFASININDYMTEDVEDKVFAGMEGENPRYETLHRKYSVFANKTNGMPERLQAMQKLVADRALDCMDMIRVYHRHANPESIAKDDGLKGMSYLDRKHATGKGAKKTQKQ